MGRSIGEIKVIMDAVENQVLLGKTRTDLHKFLIEEYGCKSYYTRHKYIEHVYKNMFKYSPDKKMLMNMYTQRLEDIVKHAIEFKDVNAAVNAIKEAAKINGIYEEKTDGRCNDNSFSVGWSDD
jgi:hypothetical protein